MSNSILGEYLILLILLIIGLIGFFLYFTEKERTSRLRKANPQKVIREAAQKSHHLIMQALHKSQAILGQAETESIDVVKKSKSQTQDLEEKYTAEMSKLIKEMESGFSKEIAQAEKEYTAYLMALREQSQIIQASSLELTNKRSTEILAKFESNLAAFLSQTEKQSLTSIDNEIQASRQLIENYKQQQLQIIDENIIAMLEKTLSLVLAKKITLNDELDLVYEALDKAKAEKFIV